MLTIDTLEKVNFIEIASVFNLAFSDYFLPVRFTENQLEEKFRIEGGQLDLSVGVFYNKELVAFILHFIDIKKGKKVIYNGGTGVIPKFRGKRLTSKMYDFILPKLRENQVDKMVLEVLIQNHTAQKIYESIGFQRCRTLLCFGGKLDIKHLPKLDDIYNIVNLKTQDWENLTVFCDYPNAWTNSNSAMQKLGRHKQVFGILKENQILAYLIYNPKIKRIHQFAINKNYRNQGLGTHLLNHLSHLQKESISMINIDSRIPFFKDFLEKNGLKNSINQYEMEMNLMV